MIPEDDEEAILTEEVEALNREYAWVLKHEVHNALRELTSVLTECVHKFPMSVAGVDKAPETEKLVLATPSTTPPDQVKVLVTLHGDTLSHADINLKLPRSGGKDLYANTCVREDVPWRLQQIQDAANHLQMAVGELEAIKQDHEFKSAAQVDSFLSRVLTSLHRSRTALVSPRKRTLEELGSSKQAKSLQPPLPPELALSFYVQGWKLVLAVYHIINDKGISKFNRYQAECPIPWANDVLMLLTVGLQNVQQLKDKVNVFSQYQDVDFQPPAESKGLGE